MPPGYQLVQANHATADFAYEHPSKFKDWKESTNTIVTLQIPTEQELIELFDKLTELGATATLFREPDINDEATSFCMYGTNEIRKKVSNLKLSLKQ